METLMLLKVGRHTRPKQFADLVRALIDRGERVEIRVIGADSLNRAVKGLIMARHAQEAAGRELTFRPSFDTVEVEGRSWSALHLVIECVLRPPAERLAGAS